MPRMTGKRALMEQLIADGTTRIFGNPGTTEQGFMDILQEYPQVEFMLALHEGVAVCMADAYARLTRRPAFVELHIAPGLGNALGMMHNARDRQDPDGGLRRPVAEQRAVPGAAPLRPARRDGEADRKWSYQVEHAHDVPRVAAPRLQDRRRAAAGPVFLSLPMDVLDEEAEVDIAPTTYVSWKTRPDLDGLRAAAELLAKAKTPMLMVGDSVNAADAQDEAAALAELIGAPIFECYASEYNVASSHPLNLGSVNFVTAGAASDARATATC